MTDKIATSVEKKPNKLKKRKMWAWNTTIENQYIKTDTKKYQC